MKEEKMKKALEQKREMYVQRRAQRSKESKDDFSKGKEAIEETLEVAPERKEYFVDSQPRRSALQVVMFDRFKRPLAFFFKKYSRIQVYK